jgi:3'-phosphoadenosine 5'-phosphosulfate sulfotransferase (PAPS reductase)/FAD synthetase
LRKASTRSPRLGLHTDVMKTEALKQALDQIRLRRRLRRRARDEEKIRAKERIFSFRTAGHRWDPKNQRPELWNLYNTRKAQGRKHPRLPDLQLDRAGHLAIHPPREHPDRAAVLRRAERPWSSAMAR